MPVVNYIWDELSDNVQLESDESGNVTAEYENEPGLYGQANNQTRDGVTSTIHYDGQHSTRALTDSCQNLTDTFTYNAFGEAVERTGVTEIPYQFQGAIGYQSDRATVDTYVRRRVYRQPIGRWLSPGSLFFDDGNLFTYAKNNPIRYNDPSGRMIKMQNQPASTTPNTEEFSSLRRFALASIVTGQDEEFPNRKNPDDITEVCAVREWDEFNCHAFALGIEDWIDGQQPPQGMDFSPRGITLDIWYYDLLWEHGYRLSATCEFECGKKKIAAFGVEHGQRPVRYKGRRTQTRYRILHSAVQHPCCVWMSKMGFGPLVMHGAVDSVADGVGVLEYGQVLGCFEKRDRSMTCGCDVNR